MESTARPIRFGGSQLDDSRHVCAFFNNDDEEYRVILPFIKDGLKCGDKVVHLINEGHIEDHLLRLEQDGIDHSLAERSGQLQIQANTEAYLRDGRFDQERMLGAFEHMATATAASTFPRNRIVCRMDWAAGINADDVVEFEARANDIWARHDDAVICTYDLGRFGGETVIDIMRTHPMVLIGGILQRNPFFVPPHLFLQELRQRRSLRDAPPLAIN